MIFENKKRKFCKSNQITKIKSKRTLSTLSGRISSYPKSVESNKSSKSNSGSSPEKETYRSQKKIKSQRNEEIEELLLRKLNEEDSIRSRLRNTKR